MAQEFRIFVNYKRITTAVLTKKGEFWQVFPEKKLFSSERDWQSSWRHITHPVVSVESSVTKSQKAKPLTEVRKEEWLYQRDYKYKAPPGTYYIGDLCYALDKKLYHGIFGSLGGYDNGLYTKRGSKDFFMMASTQYGDGEYQGSDGHLFSVDAGIIGIAPISLCSEDMKGGHVYTFKDTVSCSFYDGTFTFESEEKWLEINTGGGDSEDDHWC